MTNPIKSLRQRLIQGSEESLNGCRIWKRASCGKYGKVSYKNKSITTHRASYMCHKGDVPEGLMVCHSCDVPRCINPDHLFLGTQKDNITDARLKGRMKGTSGIKWTDQWRSNIMSKRKPADKRGEKHHLHKLSEIDVKQIKKMLEDGINQQTIAKKFKVDPSNVSHIKRGIRWSHLK